MKIFRISLLFCTVLLTACVSNTTIESINNATSKNGLSYDFAGKGESTLVLIHGSNLDKRMWDNNFVALQRNAKVLRYDQSALGNSETPTIKFSNHNDLIELLNELNEKDVTLIGLSSGAQIALDVSLIRPDLVNRLILVSPSLFGFTPSENPPYLQEMISALQNQNYSKANEILINSSIMQVPDINKELVKEMINESKQWQLPYNLMQAPDLLAIKSLHKIKAETYVLIGSKDVNSIKQQEKLIVESIPAVTSYTIKNGGHLLNLTSPSEFNELIEKITTK